MEDKRGGCMELPGVLQIMSETAEHDLISILWQVVLLCLCFMYDLNQSRYACIVMSRHVWHVPVKSRTLGKGQDARQL